MNPTTNVKTFSQKCGQGIDASSFIANRTEPLEKVAKLTHKTIEFVQVLFQVSSNAFINLASRARDTAELIEAVQIIERVRELSSSDAEGRSFFQANNWQKIADRVFLTAHSTFKTTGFLVSMGLITLGRVGAFAIGHLTVFKLMTEVLVCISSVFGVWDNTNKLSKCYNDLNLSSLKIEKWTHRTQFLGKVRVGEKETVDKLEQSYEEKSFKMLQEIQKLDQKQDQARAYITALETSEKSISPLPEKLVQKLKNQTIEELTAKYTDKARVISDQIADLQQNQKKYDERLVDIAAKEYQALADKLSKKDIQYQILKWEHNKDNTNLSITKSWLGVAKGVFKIALVTLALFLIALDAWAAPCLLTLLALAIIHDSLGLSRILHDEYLKLKPFQYKQNALAASAA